MKPLSFLVHSFIFINVAGVTQFMAKICSACTGLNYRDAMKKAKIHVENNNQSRNSNTDPRIPGYTRGGVRCLGEVSIPCGPLTAAMSQKSKSGVTNV